MTTETNPEPKVVTRIFINEEGDVVVTDLWDDVCQALFVEDEAGEHGFRD